MTGVARAPFMLEALKQAKAAGARDEVPVGAVIVKNGEILARAGNLVVGAHDPSGHAEIRAIRQACAQLGTERLNDADIYVTLEPCAMCAAAIANARLRRVYYGAEDVKSGGTDNGVRFFESPTCHHRPEVISGIIESECAALLKAFFAARR